MTSSNTKKKKDSGPKFYGSATVGIKGQIVIPPKLRKDIDIKIGDTLIFISRSEGGDGFGAIKPESLLLMQKKFEKFQKQMIGK